MRDGDSSSGLVAREPEPLYAIVFSVAPPAVGGEPVQLLAQVGTDLNSIWFSRVRFDPRSLFSLPYCFSGRWFGFARVSRCLVQRLSLSIVLI